MTRSSTAFASLFAFALAAGFAGSDGDGPVVRYSAPADTNPGREAWLVGGGDNAEVVYDRR